ncbi:MAG: hypothetical protein ACD_52C00066G0001 [uncultured bacterium]|uniref:DNA polymerase III subunit delta n=1 Tax=Candidatus Woesebacteria bacterium RIFCSPHIGHO2_12_FULL_41_24 TaxID=1802510 RepID=A0A1F8ARP7_9BACT|nr:MAG: hypothetical protein ACD_52C00066G0001 [uncultured bacterium]OGM13385.1 MAG: hypothetical protein A2W15_05810 [Candidatus Woesebacteria bacterium RBG_16_41_13]OGM30512.1 MAG: hypothetical protein A2873_02715 [Candidatus Woesebacteria bacterium RIFCSPHIGHO2_01_FULL_42_80]OGM35929.1 MAG: hypothetical protein A3D84_01600 [Candidatus Woesebacteria bacterium RIFCSPHIGHO2_02_FULL_42_20]OGM54179.1 MAG: hypothetical protein A3E44_00660 [Candidatus Woesebacteria bacterium RIFCSPHIGHO2_12_FULL_41
MHAYLVISQDQKSQDSFVAGLTQKSKSKIMRFPVLKIEDVRQLGSLTKIKQDTPTIIVLESFQKSSEEAQNALLKSLEEPQKDVQFIITTDSLSSILPTIISRCRVINLPIFKHQFSNENRNLFDLLNTGSLKEKFDTIADLKTREDAIKFLRNYCLYLQTKMPGTSKALSAASVALTKLKANANVNLQLINLVVNS